MGKLLPIIAAFAALCSCTTISSFVHDDDVVAKVGKYKLYKSELDKYVPEFVSPEDSANLAMQYINTWATDYLYEQMATEQLSKAEMDVTAELDDYRRSLLKYRYEQRYVNDRLDTLVTDQQVQAFYDAHKEQFQLERPVLKVRFIDVMKDSPFRNNLLKLMSSDEYDDIAAADSLAASSALRYFDSSDTWLDAIVLAKEFGVDYGTMLNHLSGDFIKIEPEGRSDLLAAYVCDIRLFGDAPIDYCADTIRDLIISSRKHDLLNSLERDLLSNAISRKHFVIY